MGLSKVLFWGYFEAVLGCHEVLLGAVQGVP